MNSTKNSSTPAGPAPIQPPKLGRGLPSAQLDAPDPDYEPGELRCVELAGGHLGPGVHALDWAQVVARGVDMSAQELDESSLIDVTVHEGDWSNCNLRGSALRRVEFRGVRMTGAMLAESKLRDVRFVDCRLDLANFRFAKCERVSFEDCQMVEMHLQGSSVVSGTFLDCRMEGADITSCTFERTHIRGTSLEGTRGLLSLRGTSIPWPEIVELAGGLAAAVGISTLDE